MPIVGTPQRRPASRFELASNPAMWAARAAATADSFAKMTAWLAKNL